MDLMKETVNVMQHIARKYSKGGEIDKYWRVRVIIRKRAFIIGKGLKIDFA